MCMNCLPHRQGAGGLDQAPHETERDEQDTLAGYLNAPMSRARLLRGAGSGLVAALTAGALSRVAALAATARDSTALPYLVLIVLDGARPEYLDVAGIPHVRSLIQSGTRYSNAFAGILESETPGAHVSIGTGSQPARDGVLSFSWCNTENVRVNLFDPTKIRNGVMEAIIKRSGVPTLAGLVHTKYPKATVVALSGSKYYAADAIGGPDADVIMYFRGMANGQFAPTYIPGHAPPAGLLDAPGLVANSMHLPLGVENHLAMTLAVGTFNRMRQQVTLINLPEFDWPLGHVDGGSRSPQGIRTLMHTFDQDLAMLQDAYRKAGVLNQTLFVVMSDHGMMPLENKVSNTDLKAAVTNAGTSTISEAYNSAAYLWVKDESRAPQAARNIVALGNPYIQAVYAQVRSKSGYAYQQISSSGRLRVAGLAAANQHLLSSFVGPNGPDIVVLFAEGVGSEPGGQAGWKADHGGANWQAQNTALIVSGPGVRAGYVSSSPARLIDVAPTALQLMGIPHRRMQGIPLADAMKSPPAWATQWQRTANKRLLPVVQALQQQSRLELASKL